MALLSQEKGGKSAANLVAGCTRLQELIAAHTKQGAAKKITARVGSYGFFVLWALYALYAVCGALQVFHRGTAKGVEMLDGGSSCWQSLEAVLEAGLDAANAYLNSMATGCVLLLLAGAVTILPMITRHEKDTELVSIGLQASLLAIKASSPMDEEIVLGRLWGDFHQLCARAGETSIEGLSELPGQNKKSV